MFEDRIKKVQKSLDANKIGALLVSSTHNIFYLSSIDHFSNTEREAYIFITKRAAYLFTDTRYIEGIKDKLPPNIKLINIAEIFKKIKQANSPRIGFEQNLTYAEFRRFKTETKLKFTLAKPIIENLRAVKDKNEIALLRSAARLTDMVYSNVLKNIGMNMTEKEVAWRIEKFIKEHGGTLAFDSIVAFGENAAIPHHKTSNKKLAKNDEFVLLDFGAKINNYSADMTRTIFTKRPSLRAKSVYETVWQAQNEAAKKIASGGRIGVKIAEATNKLLNKNKFPDIPHGLGHGIGIEVHELPHLSPKSKGKLTNNMVFTIEPGIYIPGFGGVRIEDNFLLKNGKLERLTKSPKEIVVI